MKLTSAAKTALRIVRVTMALALAIWLGAMVFFAIGVAPVAFGVLPSRELAGNVVNSSMARLHLLAYVSGTILVLGAAARCWLAPTYRCRHAIEAGIAGLMLAIALASGFLVTAPLAAIRAQVGTIDRLAPGDPVRERFNWLHQLSVGLLSLNIVLGVALLAIEQRNVDQDS